MFGDRMWLDSAEGNTALDGGLKRGITGAVSSSDVCQ